MATLRARWEQCPNPHCRILHLDVKMPRFHGLDDIGRERYLDELSQPDRQAMESILKIHGLIGVSTSNYEMQFLKGDVFEWPEICPKIESIVAEWTAMEMPDSVYVDRSRENERPSMMGLDWS